MALARVTREFMGEGSKVYRVGELIALSKQHPLLTGRAGFALEEDEARERVKCGCGREFINDECLDAHRGQDGCSVKAGKARMEA